jgi:hypothetical protein
VITFLLSILVSVMAEAPLSGVPASKIDVLTQIYADAQDRLRKVVLDPQGRTEGSKDYKRMRAAQQVQQIDQILKDLGSDRKSWAGSSAPEAYTKGLLHAQSEAAELGVNVPVKASFAQIDQEAVAVLAGDIAADLATADKSMGERAKLIVTATQQNALSEADISKIIAGGIIDGTPVQTIKALQKAFLAMTGDTINVAGREFDTKYYAKLVAITKTAEAMERGRHNRLIKLGIDLVKVVGTFSDNFCTAFLGKVFSLSGSHPVYPPISKLQRGGPPFHPFCGKSTAAFVEDLAGERELAEAKGLADADKLLGIPAAEAQRRFKDLQLGQQVLGGYAKGFTPPKAGPIGESETARAKRKALVSKVPSAKVAKTAKAGKPDMPPVVAYEDGRGVISRKKPILPSPRPQPERIPAPPKAIADAIKRNAAASAKAAQAQAKAAQPARPAKVATNKPAATKSARADEPVVIAGSKASQGERLPSPPRNLGSSVFAGGKWIEMAPPKNFDGRRQSVVWINVPAFDQAMQADPLYVGPGGKGGVQGRYEAFAAFVAKPDHPPVEMPRVALLKGEPSVTDGRHRLAWFRDQGVTSLPVVVAKGQAAALARSFGPGAKARG